MDFRYIFILLGMSILLSIDCKKSAIIMIKEYGTNAPPQKGYVVPAKWVRKLFKVKQRSIPRYFYFQLILSVFFAALCPIDLIIGAMANYAPKIVGIFIMFHACSAIFYSTFFVIISLRMKRKRKNIHRNKSNRDARR